VSHLHQVMVAEPVVEDHQEVAIVAQVAVAVAVPVAVTVINATQRNMINIKT